MFWRRARNLLIKLVLISMFFFTLVEIGLRILGVNTDLVRNKNLELALPLWVIDDINFSAAESVYKQIITHSLPPESAEWLNCFEAAPYVQYKMKSQVSARITNSVNLIEIQKRKKVWLRSNAEGFRTGDVSLRKSPGVYRIVLLGDSTTFGWGVNQDERFGEFLQDRLNSAQKKITYEVINLGIPGYTSAHGVAVLEHYALKYSPDMIILSFGANDGRPIPKKAKALLNRKSWLADFHFFLLNFKTYRLIQKIVASLSDPWKKYRSRERAAEPMEEYVTEDEFYANLEHIGNQTKKSAIRLVFLGLCCPLKYLQVMSLVASRMGVIHIDGMYVLLNSIDALQEGRLYPELARFYQELYGEKTLQETRLLYVTSDPCHPNVIGHRIIADTLFDRVFLDQIKNDRR